MRAAFVLFDRLTAIDFVGVYDPLTRLKSMGFRDDFAWDLCAPSPEVRDDRGLRLGVDRVGQSLAGYDLVVVPGGYGTRELQRDEAFVSWLQTAAPVPVKASVCTGALLLGAAGFLVGRRAATHPNSADELRAYTPAVSSDRVADEGDLVTAGGVTAALDLGLHLAERYAGAEARRAIAQQMAYADRGAGAGPRFGHVNLVASDWRRLADFYQAALDCAPVPPERDYAGPELAAATGLVGAHLRGTHLSLPGSGPDGPTLEIYTYDAPAPPDPSPGPPQVHRPGLGHVAFAVPDVAAARENLIGAGGSPVGEVVDSVTSAGQWVTWCYCRDPEGNVVELQRWH